MAFFRIFIGACLFLVVSAASILAQTPTPNPQCGTGESACWPMAGANPQRTSWTPTQVNGDVRPVWYKQLEPYIIPKTQVVAANGLLYISTAKGLYALDAAAGDERWVFPTELPLGHSPTVVRDTVYVGGFDHKLYALPANPNYSSLPTDPVTGYHLNNQPLFTFTGATQGFDTNPLVANGIVYAGNRDGAMYAIGAIGTLQAGQQIWKFQTGGPISFSAAIDKAGTTLYFASDDAYAYALNAATGTLTWKSAKLPGAGFRSWWPVIYSDPLVTQKSWVIFAGSENYRFYNQPEGVMLQTNERDDIYVGDSKNLRGNLAGPVANHPGQWVNNTFSMDFHLSNTIDVLGGTLSSGTTPVTEYFENDGTTNTSSANHTHKPWRRTNLVLNAQTGTEYTSDFDADGKPEYAPFLWFATKSGNRYPPIVGFDNVLYQTTNYLSSSVIAGGFLTGWQIGTPYLSLISRQWKAVDEPLAYSAGGTRLYWTHNQDCSAGTVDISQPNPYCGTWADYAPPLCPGMAPNTNLETTYWDSCQLDTLAPGYDSAYYQAAQSYFGTLNGVYSNHGDSNPFIPYQTRLYTIKSNSIMAFAPSATNPVKKTLYKTVTVTNAPTPPAKSQLQTKLQNEIAKMITAGHLRPGYHPEGIFSYDTNIKCQFQEASNPYSDYFQNPAETLITLLNALPLMPDTPYPGDATKTWKQKLSAHIQTEFQNFSPLSYIHIGWTGTPRETFLTNPELTNNVSSYGTRSREVGYPGWTYHPLGFYALWQYVKVFGTASVNFTSVKTLPHTPPTDTTFLTKYPEVRNAWITGLTGYLELQKLNNDTTANISATQTTLDGLKSARVTTFSKDGIPAQPDPLDYCRGLNVARNFMYLSPELAQTLHDQALTKVQAALAEYQVVTPEWFVSNFTAGYGENAVGSLFESHSLFQAKALIMKDPYESLAKYLDVPAFMTGDLYYIDNLIAALNASPNSPAPLPGDFNSDGVVDWRDWLVFLPNFNQSNSTFKFVGSGLVNIFDVNKLIGILFK